MKSTLLELVKDLKENIFKNNDEQGDLMLVEFFFKRMPEEMVMQHIIKQVIPHKIKIKNRNINFFLENKCLFTGLPDDRVDHYRNIIVYSGRLNNEDLKIIWEYFDTIIALAELYRKHK